MPIKTESLKGFVRGLISVTNRFSTPKGANILLSNLIMNERGALQTCDGTVVTSVLPGGITLPILALAYYVDANSGAQNKLVGLVTKTSSTVQLYNFSTNPATLLIDNVPIDNNWLHPQMFNFAGSLWMTLGFDTLPQAYTEPSGTPTLTPLATNPVWLPNHRYQLGDVVLGFGGTGTAFQVVAVGGLGTGSTPTSAGGAGVLTGVTGGLSGPSNPFNTVTQGYVFSDGVLTWLAVGNASVAVDNLPTGGAHGISHEGAMWLFGTFSVENPDAINGPMTLRQCHLNSPGEWPAVYAAFIGRDDGQLATGIGSFTIAEAGIAPQGGLVLFKDYSTYNITTNFASSSFALNPVKTDLGCIAPRTVQFVPAMGLARLTHLGIAVYNGVQDELISEEIRPYILGGFGVTAMNPLTAINSRAALISNPPMYVVAIPIGSDTWCRRLLCYDLIQKSWSVIDLPFQISAIFQARIPSTFTVGVNSPFPITYLCGAADGKIRRWQAGDDSVWDNGDMIPWSVTTPEIGSNTVGRLFFRRTSVRMHAPADPDDPAAPFVSFTPIYGNQAGATISKTAKPINPISFSGNQSGNQPEQGVASYEGDLDLVAVYQQGVTGQTQRISLSGTGRVTIESIEMDIVEKPSVPLGQPA